MKIINYIVLLIVIIIVVVLLLSYLLFDVPASDIGNLGNTIAGIAGLTSLIYIGFQFKAGNDIAKAEFIHKISSDMEKYRVIHDISLDGRLYNKKEKIEKDDIDNILECLAFFEKVKSIIDSGVLELKQVDQLFGYRFFHLLHNPNVKEIIFRQDLKYHFSILFELYKEWYLFRIKCNNKIPRNKESFIKNL